MPNGIAVDPPARRVFYTDAGLSRIASMSYNGRDHDVITEGQNLDEPTALVLHPQMK